VTGKVLETENILTNAEENSYIALKLLLFIYKQFARHGINLFVLAISISDGIFTNPKDLVPFSS